MSPSPARPDEQSAFVVLSLFTSQPEHRGEFVTLVHDFLLSQPHWQPGLGSLELLIDESGKYIVTLARWQDRDAFEAFKQSESGRRFTGFGLSLHPQVFFLHPEAALTREDALEERLGLTRR